MTKLRISAGIVLAVAGAACAVDAWAADSVPAKAPPAEAVAAAPMPKMCTDAWNFIATDCQLTWQGLTIYGTVDAGFGWQSHGSTRDIRSTFGSSYLIIKQNRGSRWDLAPNALSMSSIGLKGTRLIAGDVSGVFAVDAGFDPYSFQFANGPGSLQANIGVPQNQQTAWGDSSRAGQFYNGQGFVGLSSPTYGTLTVFRQNALTLDAVINYDPFAASNAFSPIGFQGITYGGGNTQNARPSTSLKYLIKLGDLRAAALWQFGGYEQNNASTGAYQVQVGGDIPTWGKDVFSFDVIYSFTKDSVALSLGPGTNNANGFPIPPFLPQTLTATISDNTAVMAVAKYKSGPLNLYAGYEHIRYAPPSSNHIAFTDIAGTFICEGCESLNGTTINNTAFGTNGFGDKNFHVLWAGAKYALTENLDVIGGYYHYIQESFFGTPDGGLEHCGGREHSQCAGTLDAFSAAIDWRFAPKWDVYLGFMRSQVNGGLANGFLERNNFASSAGLRFRF